MGTTITRRARKVIGPELSLLASQAATAIDRHITGKAKDQFDAVKQLVEFLQDTVDAPNDQAEGHMFVMPGTLEVFDSALSRSRTGVQITTVDNLAEEARNVINNLRENVTTANEDALVELRNFCAALSIATSNYLMRIRMMEPTLPIER